MDNIFATFFNLNMKEYKAYEVLIQTHPLKCTQISSQLNIPRTTAYRIIESLQQKGIVYTQEDPKLFFPVHPDKLKSIIQSKTIEATSTINELSNKFGSESKPIVSTYKGVAGTKIVMNDILVENQEYTTFGEIEKYFEQLDIYTQNWLRKVEDHNLKGRILAPKGQVFETAKTERIRYLDSSLFSNITTVTFGDKTALFLWAIPYQVILIDDKQVTQGNRKQFEHFWNIAKTK